jgi:hypothetical protein
MDIDFGDLTGNRLIHAKAVGLLAIFLTIFNLLLAQFINLVL